MDADDPQRDSALSQDDYVIDPFSGSDIAIHISGALLNLAGLVPAAVWLFAHAELLAEGWPLAILAFVCASYVADFVTGFLHWGFDTWFSESMTPVRRMVLLVREHHIH